MTSSSDGTAKFWEVRTGRLLKTLKKNPEDYGPAAFSEDGQRVGIKYWDPYQNGEHEIQIWDIGWKRLIRYLKQATTACLTVQQRGLYLQEDSERAKANYEACERRYGRLS